ncbi:sarcosine oxidase subunit gamma family protein [Amycolatopsis mongoliensis]|uniref:Sarcosine oxidase subunit gamma family protein n=1 Tax=Amycolatopsis mongoliensis TaxID=715475 RepID=A0A9Y2JYN6_9PSEU|nr:sarcosine oxidase subunit gamma family protein [Amycolatopsis sp. 4-36]WIY06370.1 sarcosine oxidase subunit gamma family protein [Amycolatopsis sp. 4-36]
MTVDAVEEPFRSQLTVRLRDGHALLGVDLPGPCTFTSGHGVDILWMGPDEYLVLAEPGRQVELETRLRDEGALAVVDVSAQRNAVRLTGEHARDVLAHGCSIDLDPSVSPPGTCVQTLFARTGIVLMVREEGFTILVRQSFSNYFTAWLADASPEYAR